LNQCNTVYGTSRHANALISLCFSSLKAKHKPGCHFYVCTTAYCSFKLSHPSQLPTNYSNNITDIPEEIQEFRYLRTLRLKYNQLRKLPMVVSCSTCAFTYVCHVSQNPQALLQAVSREKESLLLIVWGALKSTHLGLHGCRHRQLLQIVVLILYMFSKDRISCS